MAKFDFNSSRYAKFFGSNTNRKYLQTFVDVVKPFNYNYTWWKSQFSVNPNPTPTNADGIAAFITKCRKEQAAPMMDLRAPLADSNPMDTDGVSIYSDTIPDFIAPGIVETAQERAYKENMLAEFDNDASIVAAWVQKVQTLIDSANSTLTNTGAQLQSTGKIIYNFGRGVTNTPIQKAAIPSENFVKAGAKVWTDTTCNLLSQMVDIETAFRDRTGYEGPMKWLVPKTIYDNCILKNQQVIAQVKGYLSYGGRTLPDTLNVTQDLFNETLINFPFAGLSPIEVVVEKQRNLTWNADETIHGWSQSVAVLRPVGFAGEIQHTSILDETLFKKYGSNLVEKVFASLDGGVMSLVNTTINNGNYKEWHTDVMMSAIPSLNEFNYHVIVNTAEADS